MYIYLLAIFSVALIDNFKNIILVILYSTLLMLSEVMFNINIIIIVSFKRMMKMKTMSMFF